jgi:NSS family neurotransmitter:Na+ symporter
MLLSGAWTLIVEGYGDPYPRWFTNTFGWGMVAALVVLAVVMAGVRWRRSPDDFVPEELPPASVGTGAGTRRAGEGR